MDDTKTYTGTICVVLFYVEENSCKNVESTLCQTSEEVTHEDNHDVRLGTPIRNKARTYEGGNPSSMQTQENPDPQSLKTMMSMDENSCKNVDSTLRRTSEEVTHEDNHDASPRTPVRNKARTNEDGMQTPDHQSENQLDTMKTMKSDLDRTVSAQSPSANGPTRLKECKVSEEEEELPEENVFKEDLVERYTILEQYYEEDGMQTPDHQSENQLDTMKTMKSDLDRTVSAQSPSANGPTRLKECKVSEEEEELPEENVFKEDLVERYTILEQYYEEDGMQTPDHQSENQLDTMKTMKSDLDRTVSAQSPSANGPTRLKECKVSEEEEELPEENVFKEDLVERYTILEQYYEDNDEEPPRDILEEDLNVWERSKIHKLRKQNIEEEPPVVDILKEKLKLKKQRCQECEILKKKVRELERKNERLEEDYGDVYEAGRLAVLSEMNEIKELKNKIARLEKDVKKIDELEDEKAILEDKNAKLEDKNAKLENKNAKLEEDVKKIDELEDEKAILEDKNAKLEDNNAKLENKNTKLEEDVKKIYKLEDEKAILEDKNAKLEDKNAKLENKNTKLEEDVKKIEELEDEKAILEDKNAKLEEGVKKIKELEDEKAILKEVVKKTKDENATLEEVVKKTKDENARLEEGVKKIKELEDEYAILKEDFRDVHEACRIESLSDIKKNEKLEKECEELRKKVRELEGEKERSEKECEKLRKKVRELEGEKERSEKECEKLRKKVRELEGEKERSEKEIENLKNCNICFFEEKQYVISPCGHFGLCQHCFDKKDSYKRKCPFCRDEITHYVKVYKL